MGQARVLVERKIFSQAEIFEISNKNVCANFEGTRLKSDHLFQNFVQYMNECSILLLRSYKIDTTVDRNHLQQSMSRLIRAVISK